MNRLFVVMMMVTAVFYVTAQVDSTSISISLPAEKLHYQLELISQATGIPIFCTDTLSFGLQLNASDETLGHVLQVLLGGLELEYMVYRDFLIVVGPTSMVEGDYNQVYLQNAIENQKVEKEGIDHDIVLGGHSDPTSGAIRIFGIVLDHDTGEPIIGATVSVLESSIGTASDDEGKYEIRLPAGDYTLMAQYIGYQDRRIPIRVLGVDKLEIELSRAGILLDEVVVEAKKRDENVQMVQAGVSRIGIKEVEKLPSFLGEVDIVKGVLQQPGVTTVGEGSSGFNVRGGTADQNLVLMDEGVIFNASHALGFFSSFNSDIVSEAVLHKGTIPAEFGGRLASVLNVDLRDGSFEKLHVKGGLGVVSSRLSIDGPIARNNTSFLLSARSSYSDWLLHQIKVEEVFNSSAFFYDVNMKLTHRFNDKNFLSVSAYNSSDRFTYNNTFGFDYRTSLGQIHWRSILAPDLFSTVSIAVSDYTSIQSEFEAIRASDLKVGTQYLKVKHSINYHLGRLDMDAGLSFINYKTNPGSLLAGSESLVVPRSTEKEYANEWSLYGSALLTASSRISLSLGLRLSLYQFLGPHTTYEYVDPANPTVEGSLGPTVLTKKIIHSELIPQPRFSARYLIDASSSIRLGYAQTVQFINQISNTDTPTPTNIWQLTNLFVPSQKSHNFSLGYFKNYSENIWQTSAELYYRNISRLIDYRDFADLVANDQLETQILRGIGRAYGFELSIKKQVGFLSGWINYTYSRSLRNVSGINNGAWYPSNFDKPNDLSVVTNFQLNRRNALSINFSYSTGRPVTIPLHRHRLEDNFVVLNFSERNAFRIPDYHRVDIAYTLGQGLRKSRKFKTSWTFSVYNLYARRNAFSIFVVQDSNQAPEVRRLSILGSAFPALTFNFELL